MPSNTSTPKLNHTLTPYPAGSLKEIIYISLPLMIAAFSGALMLFIDRLVLAHFTLHAMNAAVTAGILFGVFQYGFVSIAAIAEVFVGQHNGAKAFHRLAEPVWQMVWFSVLTALIFWPMGLLAGKFLLPVALWEEGLPYYQILMMFGPLYPLGIAIGAFFIGQGKIKIVTFTVLISNAMNFGLDVLLVFGLLPGIEPMGAGGAALASGLAQLFTCLCLMAFFLSPHARKHFKTDAWHFKWPVFLECLKVGTPAAIGHMVAIAAWAILTRMVAGVSFEHITVLSIGQSIWLLFTFLEEGLQKGVTTIASNLIGANQTDKLSQVCLSGLKWVGILGAVLAIPLVIFPQGLTWIFVQDGKMAEFTPLIIQTCRWIWLAIVLDDVMWVLAGMLIAVKDTQFIMWYNGLSAWIFSLLPTYVLVVKMHLKPVTTIELILLYVLMNALVYSWRYYTWHKNDWQQVSKPVLAHAIR